MESDQAEPAPRPQPVGFDPSVYRPAKTPDAELFDRGSGEPPTARYAVIAASSPHVAVLGEDEKLVWDLFDGERTVNDICTACLEQRRLLVLSRVYSLIQQLWHKGLLETDPHFGDAADGARAALARPSVRGIGVDIPGTGRCAELASRLVKLLRLDSHEAVVVAFVCALAGILLAPSLDLRPLWRLSLSFDAPLVGTVAATYANGLALLFLLHLLCSLTREFTVTAVEGAFTGRFSPLQFGLFGWAPAFHHPRKWRNALPLRRRLAASCAGIAFELVSASVCALLLRLGLPLLADELVFKLMLVLYIRSFLHFSPLPGSDLHSIMEDWSRIPDFRRKAIGFLRRRFVESLLLKTQMSRERWFFTTYILASVFWLAAFVTFGAALMPRDLVQGLVGQETGAAALAILAMFAAPLLLSLVLAALWGAYVIWRCLADQAVFRTADAALTVGLAALCAFIALVGFLPVAPRLAAMGVASVAAVAAGVLVSCRLAGLIDVSVVKLQLLSAALAMVCSAVAIANDLVLHSAQLRLPAGLLVVGLLVVSLCASLVVEHRAAVLTHPGFGFPYALMWVGAALLGLAVVQALRAPEPTVAAQCRTAVARLVGCAFLPLALWAMRLRLRDVELDAELLIVDAPREEPRTALVAAYGMMRESIAAVLARKLGQQFVHLVEKRVNERIGAPPFSFRGPPAVPETDLAALSARIKEATSGMDEALTHYLGPQFSTLVFDRVFARMNCECWSVLHSQVLRETRFRAPVPDELALDDERCLGLLRDISFLGGLAREDQLFLARHMILQHYDAHSLIVETGADGDCCYFVLSGEVQVEELDLVGETHVVAFLGPGDFFGEAALLDETQRMAHVRATAPTVLLALHRRDFDLLGRRRPHAVAHVREQLGVLHFVLSVPLFGDLPPNLLRAVLPRFGSKTFHDGETIVAKGDEGAYFYVIHSGAVQVVEQSGGRDQVIARLEARDFFGEIALVENVPRTETVRAVGETITIRLDKTGMTQLIEGSKLFAANIHMIGEQRLGRA